MSWSDFGAAVVNSIPALIFCLIIFLILVILVITGKIKFQGKGLTVGEQKKNMDLERTIIRAQIETAEASAEKIIKLLPPELQNYRGKYISEKCFDVMIRAVYLNHIEDTPIYIGIKQDTIKRLVLQLSDAEFFKSHEAEEILDKEVERLIKKFVEIRQYYEKGK